MGQRAADIGWRQQGPEVSNILKIHPIVLHWWTGFAIPLCVGFYGDRSLLAHCFPLLNLSGGPAFPFIFIFISSPPFLLEQQDLEGQETREASERKAWEHSKRIRAECAFLPQLWTPLCCDPRHFNSILLLFKNVFFLNEFNICCFSQPLNYIIIWPNSFFIKHF